MSETKSIAEALAKAQGQIQAARKTSENPAFKRDGKASTYADIAEVIEVIQKPASENGLSVIFDFTLNSETLFINYVILHTSGEKIVGSPVPMFLRDKTVHGFGASNTFMRRQLLKAIYQIPEEDDDGNVASGKAVEQTREVERPKAQAQVPNHAPVASPGEYVLPFGKFREMKIKDINPDDLNNYVEYLINSSIKNGKPMLVETKRFVEYADEFLNKTYPDLYQSQVNKPFGKGEP